MYFITKILLASTLIILYTKKSDTFRPFKTTTAVTSTTISEETQCSSTFSDEYCTCHKEDEYFDQPVLWKSVNEKCRNKLFITYPLLIDENNFISVLTCLPDTEKSYWSHEPKKFQEDASNCPGSFEEEQGKCIRTLEELTYDMSKCPYHYKLTDYVQNRTSTMWISAKRLEPYGEFFITEFSDYYMQAISNVSYFTAKITESDCLVYNASLNNNIFEAVSAVNCNDRFQRICTYDLLISSVRFCSFQYFDTYACSPSSFYDNQQNICYCNKPLNADCTYAQFLYPYEDVIGQNCTLAMHIDNTSFVWNATGASVSYSKWNYDWNIGARQIKTPNEVILTYNGWELAAKKHETECNICVHQFKYHKPEFYLTWNNKQSLIVLTIPRSQQLPFIAVTSKYDFIFCLTNGMANSTKSVFHKFPYNNTTVHYSIQVAQSGLYWCEAFEINEFEKIESEKVVVNIHNIYTFQIRCRYDGDEDPTSATYAYYRKIKPLEDLYKSTYSQEITFKWMKTQHLDHEYVTYVVHISYGHYSDLQHFGQLSDIEEKLVKLLKANQQLNIQKVTPMRSVQFCVLTVEITSNDLTLVWPQTPVGKEAEPDLSCFSSNCKRIKRTCGGDYFNGTQWEPHELCAFIQEKWSPHTDYLTDLLHSNSSHTEILTDLLTVSGSAREFATYDVLLTSKILHRFRGSNFNELQSLTSLISNIMMVNSSVLSDAQIEMNATDQILDHLDTILLNNVMNVRDKLLLSDEHFINFIYDPALCRLRGVALISHENGFEVKEIYVNASDDNVYNMDGLELAVLLPNDIINAFPADSKVVFSIFIISNLFNENEQKLEAISKNIGVLLLPSNTSVQFSIIFKSGVQGATAATAATACSYWNYGLGVGRGSWLAESDAKFIKNSRFVCEFRHVTHFGLLLMNKEIEHGRVLDVITAIEAGFSVVGVLGLFLTAALFKNWRRNKGNRLLLNYATLFLIQIVLLFISNGFYDKIDCILIGALLHYTTLSQFCFTLVIAVFQYKRYVQVFNQSMKWVLVKSYLTCYLIPTIPVGFLLAFFHQNYYSDDLRICYPSDAGLIYTVIVPIVIVLVCNLIIFMKINLELFKASKTGFIDKKEILLRIRLVVLMFFMLGLTWIFGVFAVLFQSLFFLYVFNITYSLQGFILFIFFIIFNKNVRRMYVYMWKKYKWAP